MRGEDSKLAAARGSSRAPGRPLMGVGSPTEAAANACLTSRSNSCTHVTTSAMWGNHVGNHVENINVGTQMWKTTTMYTI